MWWFVAASWASTLTIDGVCGAPVDLAVDGLTPGADVAFFVAEQGGSSVLPGGPCSGSSIDLDASWVHRRTVTADPTGAVSARPTIPTSACKHVVQVMDLSTCAVSNTVQLREPVDADGDGWLETADCDDADPFVFPGAPEVCDGRSNDCDGVWLGDDGLVTWFGDQGTVDLSASFVSGQSVVLDASSMGASGVLRLCPGAYQADIRVDATMGDVTIEGVGEASTIELDAGNRIAVLATNQGAFTLQGLSIVGGYFSGFVGPSTAIDATFHDLTLRAPLAISDIYNAGGSQVALDGVTTRGLTVDLGNGSEAWLDGVEVEGALFLVGDDAAHTIVHGTDLAVVGDGIYADHVTFEADGLHIDGTGTPFYRSLYAIWSTIDWTDFLVENSSTGGPAVTSQSTFRGTDGVVQGNVSAAAGAGMYLDGDATLTRVQIVGNTSTGTGSFQGAGLLVGSEATVTLVDSLVADNTALGAPGAGAVVRQGGVLVCDKVDEPVAGFVRNDSGAHQGGGVFLDRNTNWPETTEVVSLGCDWGQGVDDNGPQDVFIEQNSLGYSFDDDATFACLDGPTQNGCQ